MELFKILGKIAVEGADDAENKLKKLVKSAEGGADKMKKGFSNIGKAAKTVATVGVAAFAAVGAALTGVVSSTEEYRSAMAKVETAFTAAGSTAEQGKKMFQDFYGVLGDTDRSTEAINHLAKLTNNQQHLSEWTNICTGIWGTFGDSLPIEGLTEAANETARTGELTGVLTDAINWGAKAGETFGVTLKENTKENEEWNKKVKEAVSAEDFFRLALEQCTTQAEREALVRNTLNGLYSDAADKYKENAADLIAANEAQARMTDAMAVFGEKAQPILTAVKNGFASIAERAAAFLTEVDMQAITDAINNAFAWFVGTAIPAIQTGAQWVIDNKDIILALISGIGAGFLAWNVVQIVSGAVTVVKSFGSALKLARAGQLALNAAMKANVIGIVITAVAALVAAFIYLWNNCEDFRNFFIAMWEGIKTAFAAVVEWFGVAAASISRFFSSAWQAIKNAWSGVTSFFSGIWNGITSAFSNAGSWFGNIFTGAWNNIKNAWSSVTGWFSNIWDTITGFFKGEVPIPKIKMPHFAITPAGWKIGDLLDGVIPKLGITWNARGGVFDKPTVMQGVGEDGAEAVVPLEKNLGWLDKMAGMLTARIVPGGTQGAADYNNTLNNMQRTLSALLDKVDGVQLVLDTGAVVGGIAPAMDAELGNIRVRKGRAQ